MESAPTLIRSGEASPDAVSSRRRETHCGLPAGGVDGGLFGKRTVGTVPPGSLLYSYQRGILMATGSQEAVAT